MSYEMQAYEPMFTVARPLAEAVAPDIAVAAVEKFETRRTSAGLFRSAWSHVEYAVNRECAPEATPHYIDTARYLLGDVITDPRAHQDLKLGAIVLSTYVPLLSKRAYEQPITSDDCDQAYFSLGKALNYLRPLTTDEPPQWRMVEVAMLALSARIRKPDLLLYPASPREEQSADQKMNHDSYFYTGSDKLPIQQKLLPTQKTYDECITVLTLLPIIDKALRSSQSIAQESLSDKVNYLMALIVAETNDLPLDKSELKFLNFLTQAVAAHRVDKFTSQAA